MTKTRQGMNHKLSKQEVRKTVLEAFRLYGNGTLDREHLKAIAASALAWEMVSYFPAKLIKKQRGLDTKLERTL